MAYRIALCQQEVHTRSQPEYLIWQTPESQSIDSTQQHLCKHLDKQKVIAIKYMYREH